MLFSDVDECVEEQHVCVGRGECENTLGSYRCVCQRGYRGNGTHCAGEWDTHTHTSI